MSCCVFSNSENKIRAKCRKRQKHKKLGEWGDSHFPFSWFNASSGVCNCARQQEKAHTDDDWRLNLSHPLHNQTPAFPLFFQYLKANKKIWTEEWDITYAAKVGVFQQIGHVTHNGVSDQQVLSLLFPWVKMIPFLSSQRRYRNAVWRSQGLRERRITSRKGRRSMREGWDNGPMQDLWQGGGACIRVLFLFFL